MSSYQMGASFAPVSEEKCSDSTTSESPTTLGLKTVKGVLTALTQKTGGLKADYVSHSKEF